MFSDTMRKIGVGLGKRTAPVVKAAVNAPLRSGAIGGSVIGAGIGAYNADPGNRLMGAGIGAGVGVVGGLGASKFGPRAYRAGRGRIAQARGRRKSGNEMFGPVQRSNAPVNNEMFGPVQRSNAPVNSARDAVMNARIGTSMAAQGIKRAMGNMIVGAGAAGNFAGIRAVGAVSDAARSIGSGIKSGVGSLLGAARGSRPSTRNMGRHKGKFVSPYSTSAGKEIGSFTTVPTREAQNYWSSVGAVL